MSADRLHRMVDDVLQLSRPEEVDDLREVSLVEMAELAKICAKDFQLVVAERSQKLHLEVPEDGVRTCVQGDGPLLRRVLDNLVHNAVEHTPPGGTIRMKVGALGAIVRVEVSDSGPGIPAEARADIFRKFFQKDFKRHVGNVGRGWPSAEGGASARRADRDRDAKPKGPCFFTLPLASAVEKHGPRFRGTSFFLNFEPSSIASSWTASAGPPRCRGHGYPFDKGSRRSCGGPGLVELPPGT